MALTTDEQAMRGALEELAVGQPDAPVDRFAGVRRRHLRRRRMQSAVAAAAVAVVAAGVMIGTTTGLRSGTAKPAHRATPSWALPWKDNADPALSALRPAALAAWKSSANRNVAGSYYDPRQVIWYLTRSVANGHDVAVVFEVERDDGERRLVAGLHQSSTDANDISTWRLYDVAAPAARSATPPVVSMYDVGGLAGDVASNWVVVLTDPAIPSVFLREGVTTQAQLQDGFTNVELGSLHGQVSVAVEDAKNGAQMPVGVVGLPGAPQSQIPDLEPPAELVGVPMTPRTQSGTTLGTILDVDGSAPKVVHTRVYPRGYGGPPIRVSFDGQSASLTIACDGKQHVVDGPTLTQYQHEYEGGGHAVEIYASNQTAVRYAVVMS